MTTFLRALERQLLLRSVPNQLRGYSCPAGGDGSAVRQSLQARHKQLEADGGRAGGGGQPEGVRGAHHPHAVPRPAAPPQLHPGLPGSHPHHAGQDHADRQRKRVLL